MGRRLFARFYPHCRACKDEAKRDCRVHSEQPGNYRFESWEVELPPYENQSTEQDSREACACGKQPARADENKTLVTCHCTALGRVGYARSCRSAEPAASYLFSPETGEILSTRAISCPKHDSIAPGLELSRRRRDRHRAKVLYGYVHRTAPYANAGRRFTSAMQFRPL